MKKILSIIAVLFVMTAGTPKVAKADVDPCYTHIMCGHIVVICCAYDYVIWDEIYCGLDED